MFSKQKSHKKEEEEAEKAAKKLSMSARHKLKEEFQRLFQSDTIGLKINAHGGAQGKAKKV